MLVPATKPSTASQKLRQSFPTASSLSVFYFIISFQKIKMKQTHKCNQGFLTQVFCLVASTKVLNTCVKNQHQALQHSLRFLTLEQVLGSVSMLAGISDAPRTHHLPFTKAAPWRTIPSPPQRCPSFCLFHISHSQPLHLCQLLVPFTTTSQSSEKTNLFPLFFAISNTPFTDKENFLKS